MAPSRRQDVTWSVFANLVAALLVWMWCLAYSRLELPAVFSGQFFAICAVFVLVVTFLLYPCGYLASLHPESYSEKKNAGNAERYDIIAASNFCLGR